MEAVSLAKASIVIVDDHALFREGLARLLAAEPDFEVAGITGSCDEALRILESASVDLVLLDYHLGEERGSAFVQIVHERGFKARILVVTADISEYTAIELLRNGIAGIVLKRHPPALLTEVVRKVLAGENWLDQRYLRFALDLAVSGGETASRTLTEREKQVLRCVLEGLSNKDIAFRLHSSEASVKGILQQLFDKTSVRSRTQLVRIAIEQLYDQL